jgi:hypothetical protein
MPADDPAEMPDVDYRLCDRCGFYSSPIRYTATYFVLNVFSWREHYSCHVCMRRETWKMLLVNLLPPFFGFVFAVIQAVRAYGAGMMDAYLPELVRANARAAKGRVAQARVLYETMLERLGVHAGLRYNLALAHAKATQWQECLKASYEALRDCSNYGPAANLVVQALTNLDRKDEAERFSKTWGMPTADPVNSPANMSQHIRPHESRGNTDGIRSAPGRSS